MNPYDLPGPPFLVFYVALGFAVHLAFRPLSRLLIGASDTGDRPPFDLKNVDPYLIAYLRGQANETARVAIVSLLDRKLLRADGEDLTACGWPPQQVRRPLERAILGAFVGTAKAATIYTNRAFRDACAGLRLELMRMGLMPNRTGRALLLLLRLASLATLVGVSYTKIQIALERGRHNIGFLVVLTLVFGIAMLVRTTVTRTARGDRALEDLREGFEHLRERGPNISRGGATHELVMLAAIFGLTALPAVLLAEAQVLFPARMKQADASGSSCGSSCGSSSGGGGGCGGGGCGGGCGGCG